MITGDIKDAERYFGVNENFKKVFEYLRTLDETVQPGSIEAEGIKGCVTQLKSTELQPEKEIQSEAHKKYIDIHYVISGTEEIGYANVGSLKPITEYNCDDDYLLLNGKIDKISLNQGDFCIVFPEDAHASCMKISNSLKKAIIKVLD